MRIDKRKQLFEELTQNIDAVRKQMFFRNAVARSRITPQQWIVLKIIAQPECTIKDIATQMHMSSSAATQIVEKLLRNGYVTRKENPKDRRAVIIALAPKTAAEVRKLKGQAMKRIEKVFSVLTDRELSQFVALQRKVAQQLHKAN